MTHHCSVAAACVWLSMLAPPAVAEQTAVAERASGAKHAVELFDGRSLAGWVDGQGRPAKGWKVEDGLLFCPGKVGSIYSEHEYEDFELSFRWRISARGNSGVKYRTKLYEPALWGRPGWLGCEYQLTDDEALKPGSKYTTGALYALYQPKLERAPNPPGEFNESRIVVRGDHSEHWLNGQKVLEADRGSEDWKKRIKASKFNQVDGVFENPLGRIELQDHGTPTWFSRVSLTALEE